MEEVKVVRLLNRNRKVFIDDQYTIQAKKRGLRARSWFKLQEIDRLDKLLYVGMSVIDLGSSPGGWSSYIVQKIGSTGSIIACDKLPMKKIPGVNFLQGDCSDPDMVNQLCLQIRYKKVQIVVSDMAPNTTGISII